MVRDEKVYNLNNNVNSNANENVFKQINVSKQEYNMIDTVSGMILTALLDEMAKKRNKCPHIIPLTHGQNGTDEINIVEKVDYFKVVYTIKGTIGDMINNPDIQIKFNEFFTKANKPKIDNINKQIKFLYTTLYIVNKAGEIK